MFYVVLLITKHFHKSILAKYQIISVYQFVLSAKEGQTKVIMGTLHISLLILGAIVSQVNGRKQLRKYFTYVQFAVYQQ